MTNADADCWPRGIACGTAWAHAAMRSAVRRPRVALARTAAPLPRDAAPARMHHDLRWRDHAGAARRRSRSRAVVPRRRLQPARVGQRGQERRLSRCACWARPASTPRPPTASRAWCWRRSTTWRPRPPTSNSSSTSTSPSWVRRAIASTNTTAGAGRIRLRAAVDVPPQAARDPGRAGATAAAVHDGALPCRAGCECTREPGAGDRGLRGLSALRRWGRPPGHVVIAAPAHRCSNRNDNSRWCRIDSRCTTLPEGATAYRMR